MMRNLYFFFGRMNPPTRGHSRLVKEMVRIASENNAEARIYLTHTHNHYTDPLEYTDKIRYAKLAFGNIVIESSIRDIFSLFESFEQEKFSKVFWCVGSDRSKEAARICGHNGSEFNFENCGVCEIFRTDNIIKLCDENISATVVRGLARNGEFDQFTQWLPDELPEESKREIYNKIRDGSIQEVPKRKLALPRRQRKG
jgi:hypothetical protein